MARKNSKLDIYDGINKAMDSAPVKVVETKPVKKEHPIDKKKIKNKLLSYPEFWETEIFNKKIKESQFGGTWQLFIKEAILEKFKQYDTD